VPQGNENTTKLTRGNENRDNDKIARDNEKTSAR